MPRYMYLAAPGVVLMGILTVALCIPPERWKQSALALGVGVLLFGGRWNRLWPEHTNSDWRTAARTLRGWSAHADVPVICPSPFIEARPTVWRPNYPLTSCLYSHLSVYPVGGHVYPFPFETSPEAEEYARGLSARTLPGASRFAIYGGDRSVEYWRVWFSAQPELSTWRNRLLGSFGDARIVVFESSLLTPGQPSVKVVNSAVLFRLPAQK